MSRPDAPIPVGYAAITIDERTCIGCDQCVEACQVDVFLPSPGEGKERRAPIVAWPEECWHSGDCIAACPVPGAIRLEKIPKNLVEWRRITTGTIHRLSSEGVAS
jgi:NAD-dependent dihydropyrimidine dehydrogenase PreA subunit